MDTLPNDLQSLEAFSQEAVAQLWVQIAEAAATDDQAKAFLVMFEPWATARLGSLSYISGFWPIADGVAGFETAN